MCSSPPLFSLFRLPGPLAASGNLKDGSRLKNCAECAPGRARGQTLSRHALFFASGERLER
eukprot:7947159-Pyramimonas_sp.AAC.1